MLAFRVLYQDEFLLAVDKPANFHTHPPEDASIRIHPKWNGLLILERQLRQQLFPVHRLDRATSGVLLLSKQRELNRSLHEQFAERKVRKQYAFLARGEFHGPETINAALAGENGEALESTTRISPVHTFQLEFSPGEQRRYSIGWAYPETGRFHQIRRHLAQRSHPIMGDARHGDKKLNRALAAATGLDGLFLRCKEMQFQHPVSQEPIKVATRWSPAWHKLFEVAGYCPLPEVS